MGDVNKDTEVHLNELQMPKSGTISTITATKKKTDNNEC